MQKSVNGSARNGIWQPGRVVAGRYRLDSLIGAGAMGVVWRAADLRLDRVVAVKQLRDPASSTPDELPRARQRVFREARIAARLQHPLAVAVYDVTMDDQRQPVMVMEYVPSQSLSSLLVDRGALSAEQVAHIGADAASALTAAHAAGIVHRDIKPGNILLPYHRGGSGDGDANGPVKITDFGLARTAGEVIVSGRVIGTPEFLAPETARGEPHTPASDVFSLGATLYAAVEGEPPFGSDEDPTTQLRRVAYGQARPPQYAGPLTQPLLAMMREDPADRPTMSEVAQTLAAVAHAADIDQAIGPDLRPPAGTEVTASAPVSRTPRGRRATVAVFAVLGIGVLGLVAGTVLATDGTSSGTETRTETTETQTETRTETRVENGIDGGTATGAVNGTRAGSERDGAGRGTGNGGAENGDTGSGAGAGNGFENGDTADDDTANGSDDGRDDDGADDDTGNGTDKGSGTTTETPTPTTTETTTEAAPPTSSSQSAP